MTKMGEGCLPVGSSAVLVRPSLLWMLLGFIPAPASSLVVDSTTCLPSRLRTCCVDDFLGEVGGSGQKNITNPFLIIH